MLTLRSHRAEVIDCRLIIKGFPNNYIYKFNDTKRAEQARNWVRQNGIQLDEEAIRRTLRNF